MKRYIKSEECLKAFNIEVILYPKFGSIALPVAAAEYKGYNIPEGSFMPADKNAPISEQQIADYEAFIQDIEDMLSEHHELKLIYQNKSKNYSNYYSFLALDRAGNPLFRFRLRLRVSTHNPHRTKEQQQEEAKEAKAVAPYLQGKKPQKMTKIIIINDESEYDDYLDAFIDICDTVDKCIENMRR